MVSCVSGTNQIESVSVSQSQTLSLSKFHVSHCSNLNKSVLTSDNTELLRDSVSTLTKTLKHVEVSLSASFSILLMNLLSRDPFEVIEECSTTNARVLGTDLQSISKDVSGVTGDAKTRNNLKQLIESLSRLVTD